MVYFKVDFAGRCKQLHLVMKFFNVNIFLHFRLLYIKNEFFLKIVTLTNSCFSKSEIWYVSVGKIHFVGPNSWKTRTSRLKIKTSFQGGQQNNISKPFEK